MKLLYRLTLFALIATTTPFVAASQCTKGPCGPGNDMCGPDFGRNAPQYHVRDRSCGENDPNFPLYDAKHKLYHAFYQDHLAEDQGGLGQGPDIGHAVSHDLVTWAHLPVAVWNDQKYDNVAIYTGSATIVNGTPTMVYPGLCVKSDWPTCDTGTVYAIALPANYDTDPLLTNWTKPSYNPIVENVERDPSTAWQTSTGEWRFTGYTGQVWYSADFVNWKVAGGGAALWETAECPDFFELPPLCKGCVPSSTMPTHVHKESSGFNDWYTLGTYKEGAAGSTGTWTPLHGVPALQLLDSGSVFGSNQYYASKGFWDPVQSRRIYWGWAIVPPGSTQSLPREVTYHPQLQRLLFNPIPELDSLRLSPPLYARSGGSPMSVSPRLWLGDWANSSGNQSEALVMFNLPTSGSASQFGLEVLVGTSSYNSSNNVSFRITLSFDPAASPATVNISLTQPQSDLSYFMPGIDLPGDDYNVTNVNYADPKICQSACTADPKCKAYTYVTRPPLVGSCCLKSDVPAPNPNPYCTSGVKDAAPPGPLTFLPIPLLESDGSIVDLRVYTDNTFVEVYALKGRVAFTRAVDITLGKGQAGMNLFSTTGGGVTVGEVGVWRMNTIWTSTDQVLASRK